MSQYKHLLHLLLLLLFIYPQINYSSSAILGAGGTSLRVANEKHLSSFNFDTQGKNEKLSPSVNNILGFITVSIFVMICSGGGIGGGGVLVPTFIFIFEFDAKTAIPLASCTILGSSIANCLINWRKRHPTADRPLIDWDIMLIMEPLTVLGAVIGSYLNVLLPSWLIVTLLVILLAATSYKTLIKARKMYMKESMLRLEKNLQISSRTEIKLTSVTDGKKLVQDTIQSSDSADTDDIKQCIALVRNNSSDSNEGNDISIDENNDAIAVPYNNEMSRAVVGQKLLNKGNLAQPLLENNWSDGNDDGIHDISDQKKLNFILQGERKHSLWKIGLLTFMTIIILAVSILKGGENINLLNITCGSVGYWFFSSIIFPFIFVICFVCRKYLVKKFHVKKYLVFKGLYTYAEGDVQWNERNTLVYPLICSIAGLCAGMFGIGGGIIKGPLMLEMQVLPSVASATAATMILFTSCAAMVEYLTFDTLNTNFAPVVFAIGFVSALIGRTTLNYIVDKYQRQSLIAIVIGLTVVASTFAMAAAAIINIIHSGNESSSDLCHSS